jgi:hypothetical protein
METRYLLCQQHQEEQEVHHHRTPVFASSRAQTSDTSGILTKQGQHFSPQTLGHT